MTEIAPPGVIVGVEKSCLPPILARARSISLSTLGILKRSVI